MNRVEKFIQSIKNIIKYPGMFGINKVEDIEFIFMGYEFACVGNKKNNALFDFTHEFKKHVNKWAGSKIERNWSRVIRYNSASDIHSLELFKKLFESFLEKQSKK